MMDVLFDRTEIERAAKELVEIKAVANDNGLHLHTLVEYLIYKKLEKLDEYASDACSTYTGI